MLVLRAASQRLPARAPWPLFLGTERLNYSNERSKRTFAGGRGDDSIDPNVSKVGRRFFSRPEDSDQAEGAVTPSQRRFRPTPTERPPLLRRLGKVQEDVLVTARVESSQAHATGANNGVGHGAGNTYFGNDGLDESFGPVPDKLDPLLMRDRIMEDSMRLEAANRRKVGWSGRLQGWAALSLHYALTWRASLHPTDRAGAWPPLTAENRSSAQEYGHNTVDLAVRQSPDCWSEVSGMDAHWPQRHVL